MTKDSWAPPSVSISAANEVVAILSIIMPARAIDKNFFVFIIKNSFTKKYKIVNNSTVDAIIQS